MSDGLRPQESTDASQRFIPSGVDAQSWLGFEQRIQERRYRALLESAEVALNNGNGDAARLALSEARELRPDAEEVMRLGERIARIPAAMPPVGLAAYVQSRTLKAAMMLLVGIALLVGIDWWRSGPEVAEVRPIAAAAPAIAADELRVPEPITMTSTTVPTPVDQPRPVEAQPSVPVPVASTGFTSRRAAVDVGHVAPVTTPARPLRTATLVEPAVIDGEVPDDYVAPQQRRVAEPAALASVSRTPPIAQPSPLGTGSLGAGSPAANVVRQPASIATMTNTSSTAVPSPAAAAPAVVATVSRADETRVAQVLNQYARAYGQLDASAARAVWPSVDERALARAFSGLASQDVSFDSCDIDVRGATANASCRGRARYVGKIGSREERNEPRQWRFELRRDGDAWKIETAEARRVAY